MTREEKLRIEYELDKKEFESNPLHWSNNKRRMHGLKTLRGVANKNRQTKFHSFCSFTLFCAIEDVIDEILPQRIKENCEWFTNIKELKI